jgi:murein DD-endopeptidase MepM/ murein hydrolase activator NlpD
MADESQRTPEEESTSLEDRLRAEEPPVEAEDTSPSKVLRTEALLRVDEPPIRADDTSPSLVSRPDSRPPKQRAGGRQRIVGLMMLFGAVLLTALATYVWLDAEDADSPGTPEESIAQDVPDQPLNEPANIAPTSTPSPEPPQGGTPAEQPTAMYFVFPTAAADEIAAALLTPVPDAAFSRVIERGVAPFTIHPDTQRSGVIQYTVQQGDTLQTIAAKFDLEDYYSLVWSNSRNKYSALRPGTQLNIPPEDGVYYEVADNISIVDLAIQYEVDPYTIIDAEYNNLFGSAPETLLVKGMWIVIPGGEGERVNLLPANPSGASSGGTSGAVSGPYTLWGCSSNIGGGSPPYSRPLKNFQWMQGFSLGGHEGVDLSSDIGSPVLAAGGGTVAFSGWNDTGYGNVVVLAHGDTFTIYGHLASLNVRCGQSVSAGQQIATSGNSGNSTGPHLHFEVRDGNWNAINPQNYIGF